MEDYNFHYTPTGWQCPICKQVYAPFMPYCTKCNNKQTITSTSSTGSNFDEQIQYWQNNPGTRVIDCSDKIDPDKYVRTAYPNINNFNMETSHT